MKEYDKDEIVEDLTIKKKPVKKTFKKLNTMDYSNQRIQKNIIADDKAKAKEKEKEKLKQILDQDRNRSIILYNFKDFLMMFGLLMVSSFNFNLLYFPFLIIGFLYSILIYKNLSNQRDIKSIINLIIFIYSLLLLIFEIVIMVLYSREVEFVTNKKTLFLNLGVPYILTEDIFYLIRTVFGPALMIVICFVGYILEKNCEFYDHDLNKKKKMDFPNLEAFYKLLKRYLFVSFLFVAAFANFNKSILTVIYIFLFYIVFTTFLFASEETIYNMYKNLVYVELIVIPLHLLIINIKNIYSLNDNYFNERKEELKNDTTANVLNRFGFYSSYYEEGDYSTAFIDWGGYLCGCLSFVFFVFVIKDISNDTFENLKKEKEKNNKKEEDKNKDNKEDLNKNCFSKLIDRIINFCTGQLFILHVMRILAILWLYYIRSFFSLLIFLWLLFSFLYLDSLPIKLLCKVILLPSVNINILFIGGSRIFKSYFDDFDDFTKLKYLNFALGNYDYDLIIFYMINLFYIIIIYFIYFKREINLNLIKVDPKKLVIKIEEIKEEPENEEEEKNKNLIEPLIKLEDKEEKNQRSLTTQPTLQDKIRDKNLFKEADEITFFNLLKKFMFLHINKITLIVMYFVANNEVNIFHLVIIIIFMIQLLRPFVIKDICFYILILLQLLFLVEYIMDLIKVYCADYFEDNLTKIKFIFKFNMDTKNPKTLYDTSIEILIYLVTYLFYLHYQLYNYDYYMKLAKSEKITIANYINTNIKSKVAKDRLFTLGMIIKEIYIWAVIIIYVIFSCFFEVNLIYFIGLIFLFTSVYKLCLFIQRETWNEAGRNMTINLLYPRIVLFVSGIHTMIVYFYQVICMDLTGLKDSISESDNSFVKNLPRLGLAIYPNSELYYCLLPHFMLCFLALLFLRRIKDFLREEKEKDEKREKDKKEKEEKNKKFQEKKDNDKQKDKDKDKDKKEDENIIKIKEEDKKEEKKEEEKKEEEKKEEKKEEEENIINTKSEEAIKKEEKEKEKKGKEAKKIKDKEEEEENIEEELRNKAYKEYTKNAKKIRNLNIKYVLSMIVTTFIKLYWLVLFLITGFIYTSQDLSAGIFVYIFIFGITFIRMFYSIIIKLSNFMKEDTYFISKVIRYYLLEKRNHFRNLKQHRKFSFRFLLGYSILLILLFYIYGIFDLFQNGCNTSLWRICQNNIHSPIINNDSTGEKVIISLSYLLGFYVNMQEMGVLRAGWKHFLFAILIAFDVYIQQIEYFLFFKNLRNRTDHREISNKNFRLKVIIDMDKKEIKVDKDNIKNQLEELCAVRQNKSGINWRLRTEERYGALLNEIHNKYNNFINLKKEIIDDDERDGRFNIIRFLEAIRRATNTHILLNKSQNKYKIVRGIKKVLEEVIIFLLICTSISKLNLWSFVYIIISIYLITSTKTMRKYYYIFCFTILAVFAQLIVFISNINQNTDPIPDIRILGIISETLNIPWYKGDYKYGFFFGLGTTETQINLIWMDFVDIIVLYIYIDYFSYCIFQDSENLGSTKDKNNKINYYNLLINTKFRNRVKYMKEEKYQKIKECYEYNLDINIDDLKVKLELEPAKEKINEELSTVKDGKAPKADEQNVILDVKDNDNTSADKLIDNKKEKEEKEDKKEDKKEENKEEKKEDEKEEEEDEEDEIEEIKRGKLKLRWGSAFSDLKDFVYLSFHNIILIAIIIISMMVSGLVSLFYIVFSIYFLINTNKMYLGQKYYYPKAIKKIMRVAIIVDIGLQILYQIPYFDREDGDKKEFNTVLDIIGFNRIIDYRKGNNTNSENNEDIQIFSDQMALVFCKAITYLFMGIQILIYSSQSFQEYYLVYLFTGKMNLRRKSLMNAFRFNNKRIITMEKSLKLREDMTVNMNNLMKLLEKWGKLLSNRDSATDQPDLLTIKSRKESKDITYLRAKPKKEKIYDEKTVKKYIRKLILDKFLIKIEIWFYQFAVDYSKIQPYERATFERDVIQGKTTAKTFLEKIVDYHIDNLQLGSFTEAEMIEVKKFFVKPKEQMEVLEEQKEKKKKIKYEMQKKGFAAILPASIRKEATSLSDVLHRDIEKRKIVDLTQRKFLEIEYLMKSNLFQKYLKTSFLMKSIFMNLMTYCSKKFQFVCYFMMILCHIQNASAISMVYPISIFCFAIFEYPRPTKTYWRFCLIYAIIILAIKYIIQLKLFEVIFGYEKSVDSGEDMSKYKEVIDNLNNYKIGFKYLDSTLGIKFFNYIVFDALIIIFLLINNLLLIISGLWDKREQEIESIYQAMERVTTTRDLLPQDIDNLKKFNDHFLEKEGKDQPLHIKKYEVKQLGWVGKIVKGVKSKKEKGKNKDKLKDKKERIKEMEKEFDKENKEIATIDTYNEQNKKYWEYMFPTIRNEKPGNDFYAIYTSGMMLIIIYIIVFYTSMVKDMTYGIFNKETKQFSGPMIIYLILHIFFLCYDRVLYISQNRNNLKYDYIIYNKKTMKQISESRYKYIKNQIGKKYEIDFRKEDFIIPGDYAETLRKNYSIIYIQKEEYNKPLLQKYILHIFIVLAAHGFIFYFAPMSGNYSLYKTVFCQKSEGTDNTESKDSNDSDDSEECNDFNENGYLIGFYVIYMIYFIFSGMQIKFGFYDMKKKSILKGGYSSMNKTFNTTFRVIPFLYEIKLAIDWAFTPTCLDFFQWNKYESVYDVVYTTYCVMKAKNITKIGQKVGIVSKASLGGVLSFALIILLVLPIFLFSSLNPNNKSNDLTGANIKIDLSFKDNMGLIKNYTLYESTKPESILNYIDNEKEFDEEWKLYGYSNSTEIKNFPHDQIQKLKFPSTSERNWGMTKPHIINLINLLNFNTTKNESDKNNDNGIEEVQLIIDYHFQRYFPVEARTPGARHGIVIYDKTNATLESTLQIGKIRDAISTCYETESTFEKFYTPPIRLTANADSKEIQDNETFAVLGIYLGFTGCKNVTQQELENNNYYNDYIIYDEKTESNHSYLESYFKFSVKGKKGKEGIFFYTMSDKVSETTSGYSVITFYVTFVLLAGNYVRNFFAGEPSKITLTEMPECLDLINLCEGIKIARFSYDFEQEEKLYYILMELMRSPDYLKSLTKPSVQQFNERKNLTDRANDPKCFPDEELKE